MNTHLNAEGLVEYALNKSNNANASLPLNPLLGKMLNLQFTQNRQCMACQTVVKKMYQPGYCYPCTQKLASCDLCIVKPERCHFHLGTCREPDWAEKHCFSSHFIYIANTSGLKVGITRSTQIPTRWIDQGAISAIPICRVTSRYHAGLIEVALASQLKDKTDWRKMLKNECEDIDLHIKRDEIDVEQFLQQQLPDSVLSQISVEYLYDVKPTHIQYPIISYPKKVTSLNLEKTPHVSGTLLGIKGQYLILDCGVLNIRNHAGYEVELSL